MSIVKMNLKFIGNSNNYNNNYNINPNKNFFMNRNNIINNITKQKTNNNINNINNNINNNNNSNKNGNEFIEINSVYNQPSKNITKKSGYKNVGSLMSYVTNGVNYPKKSCGCGG